VSVAITFSDLERQDATDGSNFQADPLITLIPFNLEQPNSAGNTGLHISSGSSTPLAQGSCVPALPNYLCVHPLSQNNQIWHGRPSTYEKGRVVWAQSRHGICTKCVARFVSDSEVSCWKVTNGTLESMASADREIINYDGDLGTVWYTRV